MAKLLETSLNRLARFFAHLRRGSRKPYRWYEVEVACF
jgi:hypothetical protein